MRIGILADKDGWHVEDLSRAALTCGSEVQRIAWSGLSAAVGMNGTSSVVRANGTVLNEFDLLIARAMPVGTLEQVVFRMDALQQLARNGVRVINPPRAIECAVDKYLALCRIEQAGLKVPPTLACQSAGDAMAGYDKLGGDVVVKSLFGSEGFGMMRLTQRAAAQRVFHALGRLGAVIYLQRFIKAALELRLFVIDGGVAGAMRLIGDGWPANIARGGRGEAYETTDAYAQIAIQAARACACDIAGVDVLVDHKGDAWVLEVNAAPGWRALSRVCEIDIAGEIIAHAHAADGATCHG